MAASSSSRQYLAPPSTRPSASSSSGGAHAVTRRHSLFGTEDRIVLDVGSRYTKVGFSGEAQPRAVFRTLEEGAARPAVDAIYEPQGAAPGDDVRLEEDGLLWDLDVGRGADANAKAALLAARLTILLRKVYHDILMVDATQRKVILVTNPHTPRVVLHACYATLFDNLRVPSVSPMPAPLLALMAHGSMTGLVVSVGVLETSVTPVFAGRPMLSHARRTSRGARGWEKRARALLLRYGRVVEDGQPRRVGKGELTQRVVEDVLVGTAFVAATPARVASKSSTSRASSRPAASKRDSPPDWQLPPTGDIEAVLRARAALSHYDEADDEELLQRLRRRYKAASTAAHLTMPLSTDDDPAHVSMFPTAPATFITPAAPHANAQRDLIIPGWLRERVADYFFEADSDTPDGDDDDSPSLQHLLLHTLLRLPIDLRRPLARSILVTGGAASLPGFAHRLGNEARQVLDTVGEEDLASAMVNLAVTPVAQRCAPGSERAQSLPFATLKPLRDDLTVLNDHASTGHSETALLPPMLHAWFGGSLAGSLRLSSVETVRLEQWVAMNKAPPAEEAAQAAAAPAAPFAATRPGGGPSKRASFMGIVGGLDTGAFGGLAAVSRHLSR